MGGGGVQAECVDAFNRKKKKKKCGSVAGLFSGNRPASDNQLLGLTWNLQVRHCKIIRKRLPIVAVPGT